MYAHADPFLTPPEISDLRAAARRIAPYARITPVLRCEWLDSLAGCRLHFKCENLQRAGAFKFRGACNAVFSLSDENAARGVLTQSSGNHGAALALACRLRGIRATVVVPDGAARVKLAAIRDYGAQIVPCETRQSDRDRVTAEVLTRTQASYVHPFNDARVIAGQGTATLELLAAEPSIDTIIAPISGGGLIAGSAIAAHAVNPDIRVIGAEPEGARDAFDSLATGERIVGRPTDTICDGLRAELGPLTFPILQEHLQRILLADDAQTIAAMRLLWERLKVIVEPSCALPLAVILKYPEHFAGRDVGVILSGGNVDLDSFPWLAH